MKQIEWGTDVAYNPRKGKNSVVITNVIRGRTVKKSYSSAEEALTKETIKAAGEVMLGATLECAGRVSAAVIISWGTIAAMNLANANASPDVKLLAFPGASEVGDTIAHYGSRLHSEGDKKLEQLNIIESSMSRNPLVGQRTR